MKKNKAEKKTTIYGSVVFITLDCLQDCNLGDIRWDLIDRLTYILGIYPTSIAE